MTEARTNRAGRQAKAGKPTNRTTRSRRPRKPKPDAQADAAASSPNAGKETGGVAPSGKLGIVVALMRRPEGATVPQMMEATGWLAHSVRGALSGSLKKKHGLTIAGEPAEGGKVYRIAPPAVAGPVG